MLTVPPTVLAVSESVKGLANESIVLEFNFGSSANPPVQMQDIMVTFNEASVSTNDHYLLQMNFSVFTITINSLVVTDEGLYTVAVGTEAGNDTAQTLLTICGE